MASGSHSWRTELLSSGADPILNRSTEAKAASSHGRTRPGPGSCELAPVPRGNELEEAPASGQWPPVGTVLFDNYPVVIPRVVG